MVQTRQQKKVMAILKSGSIATLNSENTHRIPEAGGIYFILIGGKRVYVGHADNNLRHRIESYNEIDNFGKDDGHASKRELRSAITKARKRGQKVEFEIKLIQDQQLARQLEKKAKPNLKFNEDNIRNPKKIV